MWDGDLNIGYINMSLRNMSAQAKSIRHKEAGMFQTLRNDLQFGKRCAGKLSISTVGRVKRHTRTVQKKSRHNRLCCSYYVAGYLPDGPCIYVSVHLGIVFFLSFYKTEIGI